MSSSFEAELETTAQEIPCEEAIKLSVDHSDNTVDLEALKPERMPGNAHQWYSGD